MTWANPGPGACRGLARVLGLDLKAFNRGSEKDRAIVCNGMRQLVLLSKEMNHWPQPAQNGISVVTHSYRFSEPWLVQGEWPAWEMRDVEHTLCEFDKYERALSGEGKMKRIYRG
jgi:hypothetical protein